MSVDTEEEGKPRLVHPDYYQKGVPYTLVEMGVWENNIWYAQRSYRLTKPYVKTDHNKVLESDDGKVWNIAEPLP